jgi:hypothetical protein
MSLWDTTGRRVNWGDRFTRNLVIVLFASGFWVRLFIYIWIGKPDPQQEALTQCLIGSIALIFGYFLGRNQNQVEEKQKE